MTARSAPRAPEPPPGLPSGWQHVIDRAAGILVLAAAGKTDLEFTMLAADFFAKLSHDLGAAGFRRFHDWALHAVAASVDRQRNLLKAAHHGRPGRA